MRRSPLRIAAAFLLAAGVVTCADSPTAPARQGGHARLNLAPQLSTDAQRGLTAASSLAPAITQVHVLIQRPPSTALADTVVAFPAGQDSLVLELSVQLVAQTEQLLATVELKDATGQVIYSGTSTITATQGATTAPPPTPITVTYVGAGSAARTMRVIPLDTTILVGQGVQFSANVFDVNGAPVSNLPVAWSAGNSSVASIDSHGAVGGLRVGTTTITATGLNGITASATLHVVNPPASLQVISGSGQTGPVARALAQPLVVRVLAADGSGVSGVGVSFSAPAGGTVQSIVTTDSTGRASATATLGLKAGTYTFQASYPGLSPVSFTETATAGVPTILKLVSGNQQSDTAGKTLAQPLVVQATDSLGNAAGGATVTWTRLAGGGAVSAATSTTDANGSTSITYTLGPTTSRDTVRAQLSGLSGPNATVLFALTAKPRAPSALTIVSGNGQSVVAGGPLAQPLVVQVKDDKGNPVAGTRIDWKLVKGTGTLGATQTTTDSIGHTQTTFTTSTTAGVDSVMAQIDSTPIGVAFAATALPGAPALIAKVAGDNQSAIVSTAVKTPPAVRVTDANGNAIPSVGVTFSVSSGGGSVTGGSTQTDATGLATVGSWKLGPTPGSNVLSATAGSIGTTFTATASSGTPAKLGFTRAPSTTAQSGVALGTQPIVQIEDSLNNPVRRGGVVVTAAVSRGTLSGGTSMSTDTNGTATFTNLAIVDSAGAHTLTFSAPGLTSLTSATITLSAGTGGSLGIVQAPSTVVKAGLPFPQQPKVQLLDALGSPVHQAGVVITAGRPFGTDTLQGPMNVTTDSTGLATFTSLKFAGVVGTDSIVFTSGSLGNMITSPKVPVQVTAGLLTNVLADSGFNQTGSVGTTLPQMLVARATDQFGNPIAGDTIIWTYNTGSANPSVTVTDANGRARTAFTLGKVAGVDSVRAASGALNAFFLEQAIAGTVGHAASLTVSPHLDSLYSFGDTARLVATARDSLGNTVPDTVTWVSRSPSLATVTAAGVVTAVANGTAWIVASDNSGHRDSATVVVQQRVASVQLTPSSRNIYLTRNYLLTAAAVDGRGNAVGGSPTFTWASKGTAVATVDSTGRVTGVGLGSAQITATTGGVTGTANINVLTPITRIVVGRDSSGVPVTDTSSLKALGFTRSFRAVAHDTLDAVMTGVTFNWTSTNGSVAGLDSVTATTARATSAANGLTSIQATAQGVTGSAALNVSQVMTAIQLTPTTVSISPTGSAALLARGLDANSRFISGGTFTYSSSDTTIAKVGATTGIVTGVVAGIANMTAKSGVITSNNAQITVSAEVPAKISFGRDTLSVGRGSNASIPILLSTPSTQTVMVKLVVRDTFAYFNPITVTIPAGQTSANATLVGHNAGTTMVFATDSSGTGYASDSATLAVQANIRLANNQYYLNATDQYSTQVLLSDPSPAGGTYVTFGYSTAGVAAISPDPAFIPQGQLAANVVVRGLAQGNTSITPSAIGVNGTASGTQVYPANLSFNSTYIMLGQGQNQPYLEVYAPTYNQTAIPVTLTSSDSSAVQVTTPINIAPGSNYAYFTATANAIGAATVNLASPGWTQANTLTVISTTPHAGICCGATYNTTTPAQAFTVYAEDSLKNAHNRVNSLVVHVRSSDTTVLKVLDTVVTIAPGQYYNNSGRIVPGGSGGTAWLITTAGGHTPDSVQYTVVGPHLNIVTHHGAVGVGQHEAGWYVWTQDAVKAPLTIHFVGSDSTKLATSDSVVIATGQNVAYFDVRAHSAGSIKVVASAAGYQPDSATFVATTPHLGIGGGGTFNNFTYPRGLRVYSDDSVPNQHPRMTSLPVTLHSTDTNVVRISGADTIQAGASYGDVTVQIVGEGGAAIYATVAGHTTDTVYYNIVRPRVSLNTRFYRIGARQHRASTDFYVWTPDSRAVPVSVTLSHTNASVLTLSTTADTIAANNNSAYFTFSALVPGVDTIISSAPSYVSDTMVVVVTTPHLYADGIPGSGTTSTPPFAHWIYATDSTFGWHYASDTIVLRVVSSDTTVLKPRHTSIRILKGDFRVLDTTDVVGPGAAYLTYSDSAGSGYIAAPPTNTMTVTGPALNLAGLNGMLGMRQNTGGNNVYVWTQYNVSAPLVVHLLSTSTRVATVQDSVIIPAGQNYAFFPVYAQDTIGTIQIQAAATGYTAASGNMQVTAPQFLVYTTSSARTTQGRQTIQVYAADAIGNTHYTNEPVTVTLQSSAVSVASIDSSTVTIPAGADRDFNASWYPGVVGSAQISATDARPTYYRYNTGAVNVSVYTPTLYLSFNGGLSLGLGQYSDQYVQTPDNMTAPVTVSLNHAGAAFSTLSSSSVTIPANNNNVYFRITGASVGSDTVVGTLTSPQHNPGRAVTVVGLGRIDPIDGWPSSLKAGDSVQVTIHSRAPDDNWHAVAAATTWTLAPNGNIQFVSGGVPITSVTIPADGNAVSFYIKGVSAGTGSATITNTNYQSYSNTLTVNP